MKAAASADSGAVLDLYKLAVEMADRTSARRAAANTFFVTLHSGLALVVGVIGAVRPSTAQEFDRLTYGTLAAVGLTLSLTWWLLLRYYRRLNGAKFDVINNIETLLAVQIYSDEWKILHPDEPQPKGKASRREKFAAWIRHKQHREASLVEQVVPVVFAAIYVVLGARVLGA